VEDTFAAITSAAAFIRHELQERVSLRKVPSLTFRRDESIERGARLTRLIDEMTKFPPG
jgi:ribosome-binding factor A